MVAEDIFISTECLYQNQRVLSLLKEICEYKQVGDDVFLRYHSDKCLQWLVKRVNKAKEGNHPNSLWLNSVEAVFGFFPARTARTARTANGGWSTTRSLANDSWIYFKRAVFRVVQSLCVWQLLKGWWIGWKRQNWIALQSISPYFLWLHREKKHFGMGSVSEKRESEAEQKPSKKVKQSPKVATKSIASFFSKKK